MEQILKNKAFKLYLNKISLENFESELYALVELNDLEKDTLFFNLVILNYRDVNYRKRLYNLLKGYCTNEEILILKLYQKCKFILESDNQKRILSIIDELAELCYETNYEYKTLFTFYQLSDGISLTREGLYFMPFKDIVIEAKLFSKELIKKFDNFKMGESLNDFLEKFN